MRKLIFGALIVTIVLSSCKQNAAILALAPEWYCTHKYDAIIVPGFPYQEEAANTLIQRRVYWSYQLYNSNITDHIIYSGSAVYTPYVEAEIMAMYASAYGVPNHSILIEPDAEFSVENLYYSLKIAREKGFERIAIATDPMQAMKLQGFVDKYALDVDIIPFDETVMDDMPTDEIEIKSDLAFVSDFESILTRKSIIARIRGTTGQDIAFKPEN